MDNIFLSHDSTQPNKFSQGSQAKVEVGIWKGKNVIRKTIDHSFDYEEVSILHKCIIDYIYAIKSAGIWSPDNFVTDIIETESGKYTIYTVDQNVQGLDLSQILGNYQLPVSEKLKMYGHLLNLILHLDCYQGTSMLKTMIDFKPDNFIYSKADNNICYIDYFPPLLRDETGFVYPYIQKIFRRDRRLMTYNFGDIRGSITKLLALIKINMPSISPSVNAFTLDFLRENGTSLVYNYVSEQIGNDFEHMRILYGHSDQKRDLLLDNLFDI